MHKLRIHRTPCFELAQYTARKGMRMSLIWKRTATLSGALTPGECQRLHPTVPYGGLHNTMAPGKKVGKTCRRLVKLRSQHWIVFAYVPFLTKKGHRVWRRGPEVTSAMRHDDIPLHFQVLGTTSLHNKRLTADEEIKAMALTNTSIPDKVIVGTEKPQGDKDGSLANGSAGGIQAGKRAGASGPKKGVPGG